MELTRIQDSYFKDIFEGINGNTKVTAILDNNCVRYMVFKWRSVSASWKLTARHEFANNKKELCYKNATRALNK